MKFMSCLGAAAVCGALTAAATAQDARVRVVHASPDAPNVDVLVNDGVAFSNVAFTEISDYAALPADTYNIKVTPTGELKPVVIEADLPLEADTTYSVVAVNILDKISPLVLIDDNTLDPDNARIRFVHASPDAPAVDIALANGGAVLFGNIEFQGVGDYISVPGGSYDLEVRLAGTDTVVLPLPGVAVENNTTYTVFAMGLVQGDPTLQAVIGVDNKAARVRAIHASPDAPNVDILVDGAVAVENLAYRAATDYIALPPDTYNVRVNPAGDPDTSVIDADLTLDPCLDYSVVALNTLSMIEPLVLVDDNTTDPNGARIRFVHASPDAPAVDIALAGGGDVLFGNVEFTGVGDYITVPGGSYDLEVRIAGTPDVVLPLPGVSVANNTTYTVFAMGFAFSEPSLEAVVIVDAFGGNSPDINGDGIVDGADLGLLLGDWGSDDSAADLNGDGIVDGADVGLLLGAWS